MALLQSFLRYYTDEKNAIWKEGNLATGDDTTGKTGFPVLWIPALMPGDNPARDTGAGIRPRPWVAASLFPGFTPGFFSQTENSGQNGLTFPNDFT
jgi:hypothetical protein